MALHDIKRFVYAALCVHTGTHPVRSFSVIKLDGSGQKQAQSTTALPKVQSCWAW
jgi:hypothetical protein